MSDYKVTGYCTTCDTPVFEIMARYAEHERHPGEPKQIGRPNEDTLRIRFGLYDGTITDLTFCGACAEKLSADDYHEIWRKILRSWLREMDGGNEKHQNWFMPQFANGILLELGRVKMRELING